MISKIYRKFLNPEIHAEQIFALLTPLGLRQRAKAVLLIRALNPAWDLLCLQEPSLIDLYKKYKSGIVFNALALLNPKASQHIGHSGSTGRIRKYHCNLCDTLVDTDCARWRPTVHAADASAAHYQSDINELSLDAFVYYIRGEK